MKVIIFLAPCLVLLLHVKGFKLYGSPDYLKVPPLADALTLESLQPPSTLRFTNGQTSSLKGVYFPKAVRLDLPEQPHPMLAYRLGQRDADSQLKVRMIPGTTKGEILARNNYWCGNTFFPSFLPRRLPTHRTVDLATTFVKSGVALPAIENFGDSGYHAELLQALDRSELRPDVGISRGDDVAVSLGRTLAKPDSRLFVAGAYLLIAAQSSEDYAMLKAEVLRRKQRNRDDYDEIAQARSTDLGVVLAWIDVEEARRRIDAAGVPGNTPSWTSDAMILASHGDLSAIDASVRVMKDPSGLASASEYLGNTLPRYFRWPKESRGFQDWYESVRDQLRAGRDDLGQVAFWLEGGSPFDSHYLASIDRAISNEEPLPTVGRRLPICR